jgi:hypothetical protein
MLRLLFDIFRDAVLTAEFLEIETAHYPCTLLITIVNILLGIFNDVHISEIGKVATVQK